LQVALQFQRAAAPAIVQSLRKENEGSSSSGPRVVPPKLPQVAVLSTQLAEAADKKAQQKGFSLGHDQLAAIC
jgi:hypothetical protein